MMNDSEFFNMTVILPSEEVLIREFQIHQIPIIIYLVILMIVGIPGNSAVCYIYKSQLTERNSKFFLVYLACLDLVSCCVCIPFEISDVSLAYSFNSVPACKLFRFLTTWLQGLSGLTLVCVAYVRYQKVFYPLKGLDKRIIKLCISSAVVAFLLAAPALAIFGKRTVKTQITGITGNECSTDDSMLESPIRIVYYTTLLFTFLFSLCCFLVFYVLIGVYLMRRNQSQIGEGVNHYHRNLNLINVTETSKENEIGSYPTSPTVNKCICISLGSKHSEKGGVRNPGQMRVKTGRMTIIFLAVTISFVLSFLPFLIVNMMRATGLYFVSSDHVKETLIYNICVRSSYVNGAINPVIYSLLNKGFRKDLAVKIFRMNSK